MAIEDTLKAIGSAALARAREPSTWAATGIGAMAVHQAFPGALGDAITNWLAASGVLLAALLPERPRA
jgi:hypothetical protein